jgi:uncharacterized protein YdcH (DUF465 family)
MKKENNECYNRIFERINSIEDKINHIKKNLSTLKNIFNNRKGNVQQNYNVSNSKETAKDGQS